MNYKNQITLLKRSKSLCSLNEYGGVKDACFVDYQRYSRSVSESSENPGHDYESEPAEKHNDGISEEIGVLEKKIDKLSDLFLEQCRLLTELKEDIHYSKSIIEKSESEQNDLISELLKKIVAEVGRQEPVAEQRRGFNDRARSLLDAIEARPAFCLDHEIRDALIDFLQSDELKSHMVTATMESVKDMIRENFSYEVTSVYLPLLRRSQRRLARRVTRVLEEGFLELEANTASFSSSVYRISRSLRRALERHHWLLEEAGPRCRMRFTQLRSIIEGVLQKEVQQWQSEALSTVCVPAVQDVPDWMEVEEPAPQFEFPLSPPQPADPERSIIDQLWSLANRYVRQRGIMDHQRRNQMRLDAIELWCYRRMVQKVKIETVLLRINTSRQLIRTINKRKITHMKTAEINKQIEDGDVNGSFERALSAGDLSLVVAACRAADPAQVFTPCRLTQTVLLSLAQQLATDMVHETQLKCRYLEETLINLDPVHPATCTYLPLVVSEIRKHLNNFLAKFPSHVARRRITLIVMAANNLLK